jgi:hypothetical protein
MEALEIIRRMPSEARHSVIVATCFPHSSTAEHGTTTMQSNYIVGFGFAIPDDLKADYYVWRRMPAVVVPIVGAVGSSLKGRCWQALCDLPWRVTARGSKGGASRVWRRFI